MKPQSAKTFPVAKNQPFIASISYIISAANFSCQITFKILYFTKNTGILPNTFLQCVVYMYCLCMYCPLFTDPFSILWRQCSLIGNPVTSPVILQWNSPLITPTEKKVQRYHSRFSSKNWGRLVKVKKQADCLIIQNKAVSKKSSSIVNI